ncbi:MAG: PAS domain S-box protein [Bryobacteraceae bacterium]|jgi:PAS domain S-box-containing protein
MAGFGFEIAPGRHDEITVLGKRLADLEDQLSNARRLVEQRFRALAEASPSMIWMAGPDALHTYFNPAWLEFRGRKLEEETGNGWTEGLHADDRDLCLETYLKSFSARQRFRMQYRMLDASGEYLWLENVGSPVFNESGDFTGFIGSAADANGRRQAYFTPDDESVRMVFSLTERERQVLVLIADGRSTKEAAARLGISYKTADSHRSRILEKLGIHETASMVRYAIRAGLIAP